MAIFGFDTETANGEPVSFQWHDGKGGKIFFVNKRNVTDRFLSFLESVPMDRDGHLVFTFNLMFDFIISFLPYMKKIIEQERSEGQFKFSVNGWKVEGFLLEDSEYVKLRKGKAVFEFIDIARIFTDMSLDKCAEIILKERKLKPPKGFGEVRFKKEDKGFVRYALKDAELTQRIGKAINDFHNQWDVRQTISISQLAERIFKHHFLTRPIPECPWEIVRPAMLSYHGGKNGFYVPKGFYQGVYSYDIVSAYPFAMFQLPDFSSGDFYKVKEFEKDYVGIYKISGQANGCVYPSLFDHDFKALVDRFEDVWVTSFELGEAFRKREVRVDRIGGFIFVPDKKDGETALQKFVKTFFEFKKKEVKGTAYYVFYWKLLNSLYGKFIQMRKVPYPSEDEKRLYDNWVTGQMFHPFIASLITGHTRAYIHRLEHRYNAIHTSTDSIMTFQKVPKRELGEGLGDLKLECFGDCLLLRNKLYLQYDREGQLKKYALHGFKGKPGQLFQMWEKGKYEYTYQRMNRPKESYDRNKKLFVFEERKETLKL